MQQSQETTTTISESAYYITFIPWQKVLWDRATPEVEKNL